MVPPHWITANDLKEWANRANRQAQEKLPELLRRLVHATVQRLRKVDFPAGDSIHMAGWDGIVEVLEGNFVVPDGCSGWEMGVSKDFRKKANDDYRTRCEEIGRDPLGLNPAETAFVFVTPQRWEGKGKSKEDWEQEKNREGIWARVKAYDADNLEQWLELAPAVEIWFARLIGKWTEDAQDIESFWERWSGATELALIPQFYLAGREQAVERVKNWLAASPSKLTVQADSMEEAIAFFASAVLKLPEELREKYLSKCVILENRSSWRNFSSSENPLILIPKFEQLEFIPKGHHILIPIGCERSSQNALQLDRPDRTALQQALVEMGLSRHRADSLLEESRRNLFILRHLLTTAPEIYSPNWSKPENARSLIPALLAGAWDDTKEADRSIISQLANKSYDEVVSDFARWVNSSDPPIQQTGNVWQVLSCEVAWRYLSEHIFPNDLERLRTVALTVLEIDDPQYELPVDKRFAAAVYDHVLPHSDLLRQGLANTLAILAARGLPKDSQSAQSKVDEIVRKLLRGHSNWKRWASLANLLPTLAEAAPGEFLDAVEAGLKGDQLPVLQLFLEEEPHGSSPHTGLLWALELLAWNLEYLGRVVLVLAKLSRLDPGGKLMNRPLRSLCEIFLCWCPQTLATREQRLQVIDTLLKREPQIAWDLLCCLLPEVGSISFPTHKPRWRDWDADYTPQVTRAEYQQSIDAIVNRLLLSVGNDGERLCHLVEKIDSFPERWRDRVIDHLHIVDITNMQLADRAKIWNKLRETIYHHQKLSGSEWALPAEVVGWLYALYQKFEPKGSVYHYAWLFSFNPSLLEAIESQHCTISDFQDPSFSLSLPNRIEQDLKTRDEKIQQAQNKAVEDAYLQGGVALLLDVANHAISPRLLGRSIARIEKIAEAVEEELLSATLGHTNKAFSELAIGFVQSRFAISGWNWVEQILTSNKQKQWFPQQIVNLLTTLPICQRTMNLLASFEEEVQNLYWQIVSVNGIIPQDDHEVAIRKLLEVNRPCTALNLVLVGLILEDQQESRSLSPTLLVEVLERVAHSTPETETLTPDNYHRYTIEKIFCELDQSDVEDSEIARLEWMYLPLLEQTSRQPKLLHRELSKNPLFFAEILKFVYRSEDDRDEANEPDEEIIIRVKLGRELLESWYQVPGLTEEGTIDSEELETWVLKAREACCANGRGERGDYQIGRILACVPKGVDGIYPNPVVREIIEKLESEDLERGIITRLWNKCETAEAFRNYATVLQLTDYRTAIMLRKIADIYESDFHRDRFE